MDLLTLAEADTAELADIQGFIRDTPRLVAPEPDILLDAINSGLVFTLKDERHRIVGMTSTIDIGLPDFMEMTNSGLSPEWRKGFKFQYLFFLVRAATAAVLYDPVPTQLIAVHPLNDDSRNNALEIGFVPSNVSWPCGDCKYLVEALRAGRTCCHDIFELPIEAHRRLCREFLELTKQGAPFERSNGKMTIKVMIDCFAALGIEEREQVREFSEGRS